MSKILEKWDIKFKKHCGLKDEEFEKLKHRLKLLVAVQPNISGKGSALFKDIVYTLVDFEKRLKKLEKYKMNTLKYHEINETGGVTNIKVSGTDLD